jgi:hypothetical protein
MSVVFGYAGKMERLSPVQYNQHYDWIGAKWLIALSGVMMGTFYLAPWMHNLIEQSLNSGRAVYKQKPFLELCKGLLFWGVRQVLGLLYATLLSVFKAKSLRSRKDLEKLSSQTLFRAKCFVKNVS